MGQPLALMDQWIKGQVYLCSETPGGGLARRGTVAYSEYFVFPAQLADGDRLIDDRVRLEPAGSGKGGNKGEAIDIPCFVCPIDGIPTETSCSTTRNC